MGLRLPDSTFPPLEFSPEEEQALVDIADHIVAETLQLHDDFVADNRRLPKKEWKLVKTRDNVQVYKKRRVKEGVVQRPRLLSGTLDESHMHQTNYSHSHSSSNELPGGPPRLQQLNSSSRSQQSHSASSSAGRVSESEFGDSVVEKDKPGHVSIHVAHGIVPGTVEDVAFGTLAHNKHTWRLRNSYVKSSDFDDHEILATIHLPTSDDPFRFLGIKRVVTKLNTFLSVRDFVYIEATGMALDSNGDRVAYELLHPLELRQVSELQYADVIRGKFSKCVITRQNDASSVEMFSRSFLDLGGGVLDSVEQLQHAENLVTIPNTVECSYLKKLAWQIQRHRRANSHIEKHALAPKHCELCDKSLRNLGTLFQSGLSCQICRKMMCAKCSVEKKVTVDIAEEITQKALAFCLRCVIDAKKLSAWDIALTEVGG